MYSIRPQHALALAVLSSSWFSSFASFVYAADSLQKYPERPIRMIMPNAPGSANDTMGRILAAKLGEALSQQIVVDNRAGAGGILGMEIGKNSVPDGYTLVSPSTAATSIAPHIQKKLPYDPVKDYQFISLFAVMPNILVLHPGQPPKTVREFIDYAKVMGNKLNMASAGSGAQGRRRLSGGHRRRRITMDIHAGGCSDVADPRQPFTRNRPQPAETYPLAWRYAGHRRDLAGFYLQRLVWPQRTEEHPKTGAR